MGKLRPRKEKCFFVFFLPKVLKTVRAGSQFSLAVHSLGGQQVPVSMAWVTWSVLYPFLTCFSPPPHPLTCPSCFQNPSSSSLQLRLPKLPEGLGDRVWLPKCPDSGMIWRETRICVSFPFPQACPFAAVWVDLDTLGFAKWAETPMVFPKSNQKGPSWRELKTRKEVARALTSEHSRC